MNSHKPLIVQSDHTALLEVQNQDYTDCRDFLAGFADLVKSPEFIHTYKLTPLSLWNAAALGLTSQEIIQGLHRFSRYDIPQNVITDIREWSETYGKLTLERDSGKLLRLRIQDPLIFNRLLQDSDLKPFWRECLEDGFLIDPASRGELKQALIKIGYPLKDLCGYIPGAPLEIGMRDIDLDGAPFVLRDYQQDAVEAFHQGGRVTGGSGIIVLACGSGKTIIGLGVMHLVANQTLIITTNNVSVYQWREELLSKTRLAPEQIGEYTGSSKDIRPVTLTTYQMLTYRRSKAEAFDHLNLFSRQNWGLIIYDEVHLLPAPVFRATTSIQAKQRLGLTATLVREDGREEDVFALIGPKRYELPWKLLEQQGFIAEVLCTEYRLLLPAKEELQYAHAPKRQRFRIAAENSNKLELVRELIEHHAQDLVLIIGQYISQVRTIAQALDLPLITGTTKQEERQELYAKFRKGTLKILVVSKVANFAVDLPDANVMIQVSGTFGSRQEEAQRLGRILRPKQRPSFFYTLVSKNTDEQRFAVKRQMFLVEQGYKYHIRN
ncbi:MAG: helicase-associated domain-containing protein [Desulfohalobiaceae bacterium]|nr:helicase-associated domain-containing protein [Desulfohalobiaceae bacterium]